MRSRRTVKRCDRAIREFFFFISKTPTLTEWKLFSVGGRQERGPGSVQEAFQLRLATMIKWLWRPRLSVSGHLSKPIKTLKTPTTSSSICVDNIVITASPSRCLIYIESDLQLGCHHPPRWLPFLGKCLPDWKTCTYDATVRLRLDGWSSGRVI